MEHDLLISNHATVSSALIIRIPIPKSDARDIQTTS